MIYDRIENIAQYKGLHPALDKAIESILSLDLAKVGLDKVTIDEDVFYFGQSYIGKKEEEAKYEIHHIYADIQIIVKGQEKMSVKPKGAKMTPLGDFSEEKDIQMFADDGVPGCDIVVKPGEFAIFFPGEFHRPGVSVDGKLTEKVLFKVRM